ncbi:MAG TPA: type III PLP-dependent enzyme [Candidatus Limnocylindria bacterium]|nr:type III PLP-dependent enzyme [Candidatus Limnocylindria bacterium]
MSRAAGGLAQGLIAEQFAVAGSVLHVGGVPVTAMAAAHGTPLYVYDAGLMRRRLAMLRAVLPPRVAVHYSVKANPHPEVVRVFVEAGAGAEIASAAEWERARAAGCAPARIVFAGPGKGVEELEHVIRGGIGEIHVESDEEIALLQAIGDRLQRRVDVAIRVNPAPAAAGGAMQMGGHPAAFGFDEERLAEVAARVGQAARLRLRGVHMFAGTQILDAAVLAGQWRHAIGIARRLGEITGAAVDTIDLGGGLGIPYFAHERALDLAAVQALAAPAFAALDAEAHLSATRLIVEPGRFLAGPAGVYLTRVRSVKVSRGATFVVCDGGMHHHAAAAGNLGQVIKRDYPVVNASRLDTPAALTAAVVGPLCTPLDTLGRKVELPATQPGDLIAVLQSGAYGLSASPVGFLSHPMPAEVLVDDGHAREIRARGTFAQPVVPLP